MRTLVRIIQIFVGVLFIISGLVKANDPLGLSYKMQEFFELWNGELTNGHFFLKNGLISSHFLITASYCRLVSAMFKFCNS